MKFRAALALAVLLGGATLAHADSEPTAVGFWETKYPDGSPQGWFLITEKNEVYSARLVKGFKKAGDDTPPQLLCTECPGKKKGAHIMGLTLFYGLKRNGLIYSNGSVIDPRNGAVYHAKMWFDEGDDKTLHVRGYLGIEMLGQTTDWYRLPDDAMKKEDIPKEILAGDDQAATDKPKHAHKAKGDKAKPDKTEAAETPAAADPDAKPAQ